MSAMQKVKDALLKAGFSGERSRECAEGGEKTPRSPHVAMDFVRRALDAAAPWWQSHGAEPKNGERIVNSPVEKETRPTALGAGKHMEAMQRKAGSRPPLGKLPDTPKGMADDEAITEDALVMDEGETGAEVKMMMSEIEAHDEKNHPGGYKGGRCKLRDKISKAAKNLGMQNSVIQGLVGAKKGAAGAGGAEGAGGTEKVETKEEVAVTETLDPNAQEAGAGGGEGGAGGGEAEAPEVPDEAEKAFKEKVAGIKAKYKEARKAAEKAKDNAKVNRLVNGYVKQMQAARMEYLTNALNMSPAEAGACTEIAQKVDEGSPVAKKVVKELAQNPNLTDQQKAAVEVVQEGNEESAGGETPAPESAGSAETTAPAEGSASPAAEPTDAQFEDELKRAFPDKAEMVDTLSQKFDGLNTSLNDEQKKKFWELNEGGDEAAFYTFLGDECGFSADEVSALRDLTDAYRAANPKDYPEYAEQHKHDGLPPEPEPVPPPEPQSETPPTGESQSEEYDFTPVPPPPFPPPLPPEDSESEQGPSDTSEAPPPLPEYELPNVEGISLPDEAKQYLSDLKDAYNNAQTDEERQQFRELYEEYTAELDAQAALQQAKNDIDEDARAQEMEKKQPGFIQNMKNFFGGMLKSLRGDPVVNLDRETRRNYGLPEKGSIHRSDFVAAVSRAIRQESARQAEEAKKAEEADGSVDAVHRDGGVTAATGKPYTPVSDDFLKRGESKPGGLQNSEETLGKIKEVLSKAGMSTDKIVEENGIFNTEFKVDTGGKAPSSKQVEELQTAIRMALARGKSADGAPNVNVSFDENSGGDLTVSIKHADNERGNVAFADVFDTDDWKNAVRNGDLPFILGKDDKGNPIIGDMEKLTHLLVAGKTGSGKSARLNTMLVSALMAKPPDDLKVLIVDPKRVEFSGFSKDPHLAMPIATTKEEAAKVFDWARQEHENRMSLLARVNDATDLNVKNIADYNRLAKEGKIPKEFPQKIPQMMLLVDEFGELMKGSDKSTVDQMGSLAALARASGIHVVAATQRPDRKVIEGTTKANFPATLALSVKNKTDEGVVGVKGASNLADKGPFILNHNEKNIRGNGAFISDGEVGTFQKRVKESSAPTKAKSPSNPNAPQPVPKGKRSSPTHIANMPDGMEVHRGPGNTLIFKHGGREYKQAERRNPDGTVTKGWKLADGSDRRLYVKKKPATPPAS